ncbi:MAG: GLPGLI family protein [Prevotellaceae bacterium]|jgi:GLPGLI family protein|nr:GLPGLI family protein [Prevotellaceae bacterium]
MKKRLIIILNFVLFSVVLNAQEILDTAILRCKYTFTHMSDTANNKSYKESLTLDIGKNICKFYSEQQKIFDSVMTEQLLAAMSTGTNQKISIAIPPTLHASKVHSIVFFNYPEGKITVLDKTFRFYKYLDNIENINWQVFADEMKISGYNCRKATCRFRGRDYEAWYATDIPVNKGPYKFCGLPGLIVKISDTQKQVEFICESVEKISTPVFKDENERDAVTISREQYLEQEKKFYQNPTAILGGTVRDANGNPVPPRKNVPYNPIELE